MTKIYANNNLEKCTTQMKSEPDSTGRRIAGLAPGRPADEYLGQVDRIHRLLNQGPNLT